MPENLKKYYAENVQISYQQAINICVGTLQQNSDIWRAERGKRITGKAQEFS